MPRSRFGAWRVALLATLGVGSRDDSQCDRSYSSLLTEYPPVVSGEGWACSGGEACGRPFIVDGSARVAERSEVDSGWAAPCAPNLEALTSELRGELAEHYSKLGLMEHASVAAFARFMLELMSLGAPATLLELTRAALNDEILHAKLCFGLASAYAERAVGPGPLAVDGALERRSHAEILQAALLEACVGETIAAAEASVSGEHAQDPEVRAVFERIARDEARHAELGWAFIRWALERADGSTARGIVNTLTAAIDATRLSARVALARPERHDPALLAHGVLSPWLRADARLAAVEELLVPCVKALTATMLGAAP